MVIYSHILNAQGDFDELSYRVLGMSRPHVKYHGMPGYPFFSGNLTPGSLCALYMSKP